ncbi:ABC-type dipeptide/oligopeptide/nickel transport system, permease component [Agrobacterium fabacearum S56]|uniref:ABC transporter permease n=1 Tax=Agrobacterium tumefaciens TaxID=358 RepID=UPI0009BB32B8|nr:ABC transporter permease [Agrobacterium tumefaciens]CUX06873.1 ABC-type dipeptide/oligopeptide/nickel transport system, permease component [Agrobacterium fabacearum S56]
MLRYTISRLLQAVLVILVMSLLLFMLIGLMPGDPVENMLEGNPSLTPESMAQMRALYGVDQPIWTRYGHWLVSALHGDLGYSSVYFRPVMDVLGPAVIQTAKLLILTELISIPLAMLLGAIAARKPGGWTDSLVSLFAFASISLPGFWTSLILIIVFSVKLGWLPASGTPLLGDASLAEQLYHLILPVTVLIFFHVGPLVRYVRASMIETLNSDFVRTARAKGLSETTVVMRHALRNALIPMVTVLALGFGSLFSGALVVETIFGMLGMGKVIYDSISNIDFNLALVGLLLATIVTLVSSLLADLAYAWLDPRISLT